MTAPDQCEQEQPLRPPYLLPAAPERPGAAVRATSDASTAVVELAVRGPWSEQLAGQVSASLRLCLAGPSTAIVVDLHDVEDPEGLSMPFWLTAGRQARHGSAPVQLALCRPGATALGRRLRDPEARELRVYATALEASTAMAEESVRADALQARLAPRPTSVSAARTLVAQACRVWNVPHLRHDASLIVSELAANAVEHASTDFVVTLRRSSTRLHVAVRDGGSRFPRLGRPAPINPRASLADRGRGLWLIHQVAAARGAMPTAGGKVVWATVV